MDTAVGDAIERVMRYSLRGYDDIKPLWRMSKGNKTTAIEIIKAHTSRYLKKDTTLASREFEQIFDIVMADIYGDGCEIEWIS